MASLAVMNAFKVSHPNAMYNSQRPIALLSVTWQADELGFDTAEWKKKEAGILKADRRKMKWQHPRVGSAG